MQKAVSQSANSHIHCDRRHDKLCPRKSSPLVGKSHTAENTPHRADPTETKYKKSDQDFLQEMASRTGDCLFGCYPDSRVLHHMASHRIAATPDSTPQRAGEEIQSVMLPATETTTQTAREHKSSTKSSQTETTTTAPSKRHYASKLYMLELINEERQKAGVPPVVLAQTTPPNCTPSLRLKIAPLPIGELMD